MGRISELSDELLIKVLSFLPTKEAVSTSILSKQWKFLWMSLPRLDFGTSRHPELGAFLYKNLPLHRAPVIESLGLDIYSSDVNSEEMRLWIEIAVSRHVRELSISFYLMEEDIPSSLFTCKSLVILKLKYITLMDIPSMACLPCLKTLELKSLILVDDESLQQLLSVCPVLEDLSVHICNYIKNLGGFSIIVPSLLKLSLSIPDIARVLDDYDIDTPSLMYLKLVDSSYMDHYAWMENMPQLKEAYVDVRYFLPQGFTESITSVKRLTLCSKDLYGHGFVFNQLEHLTLCVCQKNSSKILGQLLKSSPNLRVLDISVMGDHWDDELDDMVSWNEPSSVPECLLSSLQIFKWSPYFGRTQDTDIAVYILQNACHLKTATIVADTTERFIPKLQMIEELTLSSRASSTCELVFVDGEGMHRY